MRVRFLYVRVVDLVGALLLAPVATCVLLGAGIAVTPLEHRDAWTAPVRAAVAAAYHCDNVRTGDALPVRIAERVTYAVCEVWARPAVP